MPRAARIILLLLLVLGGTHALAHSHGGSEYIPPWDGHKGLGEVSIDTSAQSAEAQRWFETGMKLFYSFEYTQAGYAFHQAQMLEPDFALAYWGEAMSHLRFLWYMNDFDKANKIQQRMLENISQDKLTPFEKDLLKALDILLDEKGRDHYAKDPQSIFMKFKNHMQAMNKHYPNNADVMTLYTMAILSTRHGLFDLDVNHEGGEIALQGFAQFPNHPGLIHMVIHSYEDSITPSKAKEAALVYDQVAPRALHALHMPTHYYFAEGMWPEVVAQNIKSWNASLQRMQDLKLTDEYLEFHSAAYLVEGRLNLEQYDEAYAFIQEINTKNESGARNGDLARMLAHYFVQAPSNTEAYKALLEIELSKEHTGKERYGEYLFGRAYAYYQLRDEEKLKETMRAYNKDVMDGIGQYHASVQDPVMIMNLSLDAMALNLLGRTDEAIETQRKAVYIEQFGHFERHVPKPAHELLADMLSEQKRFDEAHYYYKRTLDYNKNRTAALKGLSKKTN